MNPPSSTPVSNAVPTAGSSPRVLIHVLSKCHEDNVELYLHSYIKVSSVTRAHTHTHTTHSNIALIHQTHTLKHCSHSPNTHTQTLLSFTKHTHSNIALIHQTHTLKLLNL